MAMSNTKSTSLSSPAADRYRRWLSNSRKSRLPPGFSDPQPPSVWPAENVALLERYLDWLVTDGAGQTCIDAYYLPVAGHVLGFNLKPYEQLDISASSIQALTFDLQPVIAYAEAKRLSQPMIRMCGHALDRFRRFLALERGLVEVTPNLKPVNVAQYHAGLPDWLIVHLTQYQHIRQANWRPARLNQAILRFWSTHTRLLRWLFAHYPINELNLNELSHIRREQVFAYIDERLAAGSSPKSVNQELRAFHAVLCFLQERDFAVPQALLRLPGLKEPDALPRFLTDEQVYKLRADLEARVSAAHNSTQQRNALLDRAAFYLLWQGGMRLGEVEELRLDDLNISASSTQGLAQHQLMVRRGKGLQDRTVCLTEAAVAALEAYLTMRGSSATEHIFLFRHRPLCKDFIRGRIKAAGERAGVKVTPHQLRHTFATQLLNAGCRLTTIQTLLGHRHPNSTLTYARIHGHTVAEDYQAAMALIEQRLVDCLALPAAQTTNYNNGRPQTEQQLLTLVDALAGGNLDQTQQAVLAELRQGLLVLAT
jgi:site-specific recombinase XerD